MLDATESLQAENRRLLRDRDSALSRLATEMKKSEGLAERTEMQSRDLLQLQRAMSEAGQTIQLERDQAAGQCMEQIRRIKEDNERKVAVRLAKGQTM